ncbi:MAG: DEAD/DEAH box helicase [Thermoplasmata archaeon]|nr:DEAD/DEAH box helicase [Thermoplasmata archaeon]
MEFERMEIDEKILNLLKEDGIFAPTEIQRLALPVIKDGKDAIVQSETGSGKTLAFAIPIIERVVGQMEALIITPTRELANQIEEVFKKYSRNMVIANIHGGVAIQPQIKILRKANIVVATPGRLLDHIRRNTINLSNIKFLVIDEADRMLDMGFIEDIEKVISKLPRKRQTIMLSATIPYEIKRLAKKFMKHAMHVENGKIVSKNYLEQFYCEAMPKEKFSMLLNLIRKEKPEKALIFTNTRIMAETLAKKLTALGYNAKALHGGLTQSRRDKITEEFRHGKIELLCATDVASRGLDIKSISHIFNYDVPNYPDDYIHRIGRTARAGSKGKAITILCSSSHNAFRRIIKKYNLSIKRMAI